MKTSHTLASAILWLPQHSQQWPSLCTRRPLPQSSHHHNPQSTQLPCSAVSTTTIVQLHQKPIYSRFSHSFYILINHDRHTPVNTLKTPQVFLSQQTPARPPSPSLHSTNTKDNQCVLHTYYRPSTVIRLYTNSSHSQHSSEVGPIILLIVKKRNHSQLLGKDAQPCPPVSL